MRFPRGLLLTLMLSLLLPSAGRAAQLQLAPDWTLSTPDGHAVNLAEEARKRTTILVFWATWCPYCKALMPHLQSIRLEYGDKVQILAIDVFEDGDPVTFMTDAGYDFTLLLKGDAVAGRYGISGTPGVFIVDTDRAIRFDLRSLPGIEPPDNGKNSGRSRMAAYLAPYWAAEIRKHLDQIE